LVLILEPGMVIELGNPHAANLPDSARSFGSDKCARSEVYTSPSTSLAFFSDNLPSTESRFCSITAIQSRTHLANSSFSLCLEIIDSFERTTTLAGCCGG